MWLGNCWLLAFFADNHYTRSRLHVCQSNQHCCGKGFTNFSGSFLWGSFTSAEAAIVLPWNTIEYLQRAFFSFNTNSIAMEIARYKFSALLIIAFQSRNMITEETLKTKFRFSRQYCPNCTFVEPIAVPIVIHRHDLRRIAPLWLKKTAEVSDLLFTFTFSAHLSRYSGSS